MYKPISIEQKQIIFSDKSTVFPDYTSYLIIGFTEGVGDINTPTSSIIEIILQIPGIIIIKNSDICYPKNYAEINKILQQWFVTILQIERCYLAKILIYPSRLIGRAIKKCFHN